MTDKTKKIIAREGLIIGYVYHMQSTNRNNTFLSQYQILQIKQIEKTLLCNS
jgi:hypothetical protein